MGKGECTMHDDFDAFDNHFGIDLNKLMYSAFLDSDFLSHNSELRNAFEWFCRRLTGEGRGEETLLQISPTHAFKMRSSLFSGTPVTQYWGCVFHEAFYDCLVENFGMGMITARVLSDDGIVVLEESPEVARRFMDNEVRTLAEQLGHVISPDGVKSYVADLSKTVQMHQDVDIITHDMGPFLQYYPQMDPSATFGNVPRRIYSLFERERDSSDATRLTLLNQYAPSLARQVLGTDKKIMAGWVSDLHRSIDVISTVRQRYPRMREILRWFAKVYPNFWKKFSRLYEAADRNLWQERSMMAGGTRQGGDASWVVEYYNEWRDSGTAPPIP
jgi:hypothetical protein